MSFKLLWNNRVGSIYHKEDIHGNKVFHISQRGVYDPIRYIEHQSIVYFSVNDILLSFVAHTNMSFQSIWDDLGPECKLELEKDMYKHVFKNDNDIESITLRYNDIIKLILLIPVTFDMSSKNLDLFLMYYQTHFGYLNNIKNTPKHHRYDCCFDYVFFMSFVGGFLCAFVLFWILRLFEFQQ